MIACLKCHRLRRPEGLHICVPGVRGRTVAPTPPPGHVSRRLETPLHITRYQLPASWPVAAIWNRITEGKTP
jgi:hypothetical protein